MTIKGGTMADKPMFSVDEDAAKKSSTGLDSKIAVLLAYLFSFLGGLIIWVMEKENKFVKWNALQAFILGVIELAVWIVFYGIFNTIFISTFHFGAAFAFSTIGTILTVVCYVVAIIAIVMGFSGKTFRIPGIAKLTDKWFKM
jgi:uncharacterized membrane protein